MTGFDSKDELLDVFVDCVNACEPEHPYYNDPYPITKEDLEVSYCRSDGPYWAKCGPRHGFNVVHISLNTSVLTDMSVEKVLAILTHEVAHVVEGVHTDGAGHDKAFWREMAFMAWQMRENYPQMNQTVDETEYIREVILDPNEFTVDGRIETVEERRKEMADLLGTSLSEIREH